MDVPMDVVIDTGVHILGLIAATMAMFTARTAQGATAWVVALLTIPYLALPFYAVFGVDRFVGYVRARRIDDTDLNKHLAKVSKQIRDRPLDTELHDYDLEVFEGLAGVHFHPHNDARLLINGEDTFTAIEGAIASARAYVLIEFYIIKDDGLGRRLLAALIAAAARGVKVCLLYDAVGSHKLSRSYKQALSKAGIMHGAFRSTRSPRSRIQANFRNHRKIVVADGHTAFIGGHNVGDEYLGLDPKLGAWRDTHVKLTGSVALQVQLVFLEDWYWTKHDIPDFLTWTPPTPPRGRMFAMIQGSGPVDSMQTCAGMFAHAIGIARHRFWLTTPYFVPDTAMLMAIRLAHLRGVDVRFLITLRSDNVLSDLASSTYLPEALDAGARIFRYTPGFMHQKVFIVDDALATITTANFDIRSFRLNFEVSAIIRDQHFTREVTAMLEQDMAVSQELSMHDLNKVSFARRFLARLARLLTPVI